MQAARHAYLLHVQRRDGRDEESDFRLNPAKFTSLIWIALYGVGDIRTIINRLCSQFTWRHFSRRRLQLNYRVARPCKAFAQVHGFWQKANLFFYTGLGSWITVCKPSSVNYSDNDSGLLFGLPLLPWFNDSAQDRRKIWLLGDHLLGILCLQGNSSGTVFNVVYNQ